MIQTAAPQLSSVRRLTKPLATAAAPPPPPQPSAPTDQVTLSKTPPGRDPKAAPKATWTVLVYSAADNNLTDSMVQNLVDCQKVGSSNGMNVVSQFDWGGDKGCNRYYITKSDGTTLDSPVVQTLGPVNMADPKTLSDFIQWGEKTYPADHYMVIISDHGDGWRGAVEDDSSGGAWMSLPQIQQGLQTAQDATGIKPDILGFDACLMANSEVADQLMNNCDFMVGSEETEGDKGWPYTRILNSAMLKNFNMQLLMKSDTTARDLASSIVTDATGDQDTLPTLSAFDMSQVANLNAAEKGLADAIKATSTPVATLQNIAASAQQFDDTTDLYDFADKLSTNATITDNALKAAANTLKQVIPQVVFAEQHSATSYPGAHGITVNLSTDSSPGSDYTSLQMPQDTGWDGALAKMSAGASPADPQKHKHPGTNIA